MRRILRFLKNRIYEHIIKPVIVSASPVNEVALGMAIGVFVGLTPTVGIQMWIVFIIWLFFRYVLRIKFDLIIGTALVWISNPFTMFFMYYGFLATGIAFFASLGIKTIELGYDSFFNQFSQIIHLPNSDFFDFVARSSKFLLIDLGCPLMLGSLFYAIPFSLMSYFLTQKLLLQYRTNKARQMGIDYETWRTMFERSQLGSTNMCSK